MSRKALQLGFCLVVVALAVFTAPVAQAIDFSYTEASVGSSQAKACANAIEELEARCDSHGPITTQIVGAKPIYGPEGNVVGYMYTCEATTTYCRIFIGPQF